MEALSGLHHRHHQPPCSSFHYHYCDSQPCPSFSSSLFLSPPASSLPSSPSIRASSLPSTPPSSDPPLQNHQKPEPKSQFFNFDPPLQNPQFPEAKSPQISNPLPKVPSFDPPLQNVKDPDAKSPQIFNLTKVPSFATITAASAFLFLGFCQNGFNKQPITTLSLVPCVQEALDESSNVEELLLLEGKPDHVQSVLRLKLREKVPIVHSFEKTRTDDDEAWQVLKAQVSSCSVELELVKVGFEEILEKDPGCSKAYHDRVLEYLEMVDECKSLLKGIKVAMDMCERENRYVQYHLRFFNKVVARVRVLEGDMVGALKHFQGLEQD